MLDVCLLGTGGVIPMPNRWLTSLLIRCSGKLILIDCGEGTQIPLSVTKWGFKAIDVIMLTHYHADHVAGLPGLLLTIGNSGREEALTIIGPTGLKNVIDGLSVIFPQLPFELTLIELSAISLTETVIGDIIVKSLPMDHTLPGLAYCVELKRQGKFNAQLAQELDIPKIYWKRLQKSETINLDGRLISPNLVIGAARKGIKLCYCTDSRPTDDLIDFIKDSDLFVCEGMYADDESLTKAIEKKHMLFKEAAELAKKGGVKKLWLTHFSPSLKESQMHINAVKDIFENTYLGEDLLKDTLMFEVERE